MLFFKNRKSYIFFSVYILFCVFLLMGSFLYLKVMASSKLEGIEKFPDTYQPYLRELEKKYPNWKFMALYTNLDWNYVIDQENVFGKNLVPKNYSDNWKNTTPRSIQCRSRCWLGR